MKKRNLIIILVISIVLFLGIIPFVIFISHGEEREQKIEKTTDILKYLNANRLAMEMI